MRAHTMFDVRTKARSLAFLYGAGALICVLTVLLPHVATLEERSVLIVAALSLAMALAFLRFADKVSDRVVHLALAVVTVMLSLIIHYTHNATLYALIYTWPALYAFYFFSTPVALAHLAFIGATYTTVLRIDDTMDATIRLVLVLGTPLVVGLLISRLLGVMRAALDRGARQERALRSSERRTRLIVDSARDGFISTDAQGRVLDINAAAERLLGRPRAEALGRPFQELGIPPEAHGKFIQRRRDLLKAAREGGTRHLEMRVTIDRPDGTKLRGETMIWVVERDGELMFNARLTDIGDRLLEERRRERLVRSEVARLEAERAALTIGRLQAVADTALTQRDLDALGPEILARTREVLDAEAAALLLIQDDGTLSLLSSDPVVSERRPERVSADAGIAGRVLATRRPVLLHDPPASELADPSILDAGISSMLGVPLFAHETIIGVIEVGVRAPRRLAADDVDLLRLTADRVALAIEHVRAYGREHHIADTLQRSLLPQTLPALPGVALAGRYLPAASEAEVGGDWYDAIGLTGGRVLLVMGDVSGKGLAAASTVGALRSVIRAYALDGHGPAQIAERLNTFVLAEPSREHMATLVLAVFDPVDAELSYVSAGHPPPLTLSADGTPRFLSGARSVPLGVLPFPSYSEETVTLEPGGAVVLYTDGLVERRAENIDLGLARLSVAAGDGTMEAEALCDRLLAAALPAGATGDDVALLTLCHVPLGSRLALDLPSEPGALRSLRALLRRWLGQAEASDADVHAIVMACSEACTNAIEHAGAAPDETIAFEAILSEGEVEIVVRDRGHWREGRPPSDQGRGLELIDALMDDVQLETSPEGTTIRLRRRLTEHVRA
ncbi:MAG TPA: SpoIIE family protein phosphatase [Solirubrobacteraceae bacterium]|nr:SpoIIE family protein phosphatase [Solirubrobacteraceae bacterium]